MPWHRITRVVAFASPPRARARREPVHRVPRID